MTCRRYGGISNKMEESMKGNTRFFCGAALIALAVTLASCGSSQARGGSAAGDVYNADILVIGGGIAGLSAAIEAADRDASVVLLEKMPSTGGASAVSGGEMIGAGTDQQKADGISDRWEALADFWVTLGEGHVNEGMLRSIAEKAPANINWMLANGVKLMDHMETPTAEPWANPKRTHKAANGAGTGFTDPLAASAESKGVTILTGHPAQSLIVEGGAVKGAKGVNSAGKAFTVNAKKVILATGGYDSNKELMKEYSPLITTYGALGEAHNGDGLVWARELGSPIIAGGGGIVLAINFFLFDSSGALDPYGAYLYVDASGKRFMDESLYWFRRSRTLLDMTPQFYYAILDSKAASGLNLDAGIQAGAVFKADTIAELAAKTGMNPAVLQPTVAKYNSAAAAKKDSDFGKAPAKLAAISQGPFYAALTGFDSNSGSFGGPKINDNCQVLGSDGSPIPGLYAAGEVANGEIFYKNYPISGSALQIYSSMGRIAAAHAAASL
jgi:fumarate reductase flavoprotein subunit